MKSRSYVFKTTLSFKKNVWTNQFFSLLCSKLLINYSKCFSLGLQLFETHNALPIFPNFRLVNAAKMEHLSVARTVSTLHHVEFHSLLTVTKTRESRRSSWRRILIINLVNDDSRTCSSDPRLLQNNITLFTKIPFRLIKIWMGKMTWRESGIYHKEPHSSSGITTLVINNFNFGT